MKGTRLSWITVALPLVLSATVAAQPRRGGPGEVTLPLAHYSKLIRRLEVRRPAPAPPEQVVLRERSLEGVFRKGLLAATLTAKVEVLQADGHVRVPILDSAAFLEGVTLQGKQCSPAAAAGMYTVGVDRPGLYTIKARFYVGREQERFARRLRVKLPPGGSTRVSILIPEGEIEARLRYGALLAAQHRGQSTRLRGHLDASGMLDLTWSRRVTHRSGRAVQMEARLNTLYTLRESVVSGLAVFDFSIRQGEVDRVDLNLPAGVEVMKVTGDAVLQWQSTSALAAPQRSAPPTRLPLKAQRAGGKLAVLLRYLAQGTTRVAVHFQAPIRTMKALPLPVVLPPAGVPLSGVAAVQAPTSLDVKVARRRYARTLLPGDLPPELTDLTRSPLLHGFAFTRAPQVVLALARNEQVRLTSTLIDAQQAATVLTADGAEVTKLKLHIRNNTRQYLRVGLPAGARLTHALLDGQPVRPAVAPRKRGEQGQALLFSLRQSERVEPNKGRTHRVKPGETLGDIALLYYSDPDKWRLILEHNRAKLSAARDLLAGQQLRIPSAGPVTVEESSFVLELSYRRRAGSLGALGAASVTLPSLDIDAMKTVWHLYLPAALTPLRFSANLTQYSAIKYGPFRRALDFVHEVFSGGAAWAGMGPQQGGGKYTSILSKRKGIFRAEARRRSGAAAAPAAFPLVGQRYRFKRLLSGHAERPTIGFTYASTSMVRGVRLVALLLALAAALAALRWRRRLWVWFGVAGLAAALLLVAHHVPGVHRRLVWGVALGLLLAHLVRFVRCDALQLRALAWAPWTAMRLATPRALGLLVLVCCALIVVVNYPLLLSCVAAAVLALLWKRQARQPRQPRQGTGAGRSGPEARPPLERSDQNQREVTDEA
jgi:LysM domain